MQTVSGLSAAEALASVGTVLSSPPAQRVSRIPAASKVCPGHTSPASVGRHISATPVKISMKNAETFPVLTIRPFR